MRTTYKNMVECCSKKGGGQELYRNYPRKDEVLHLKTKLGIFLELSFSRVEFTPSADGCEKVYYLSLKEQSVNHR